MIGRTLSTLVLAGGLGLGLGLSTVHAAPTNRGNSTTKAIEACKNKNPDQVCSISYGSRTKKGKCKREEGKPLMCVVPRSANTPAKQACHQRKVGDPCMYDSGDNRIQGTCQRRGKSLICKPKLGRK